MRWAARKKQGLTEAKPLRRQQESITSGGQMSKRWSREQDLFLEEHANKGAEWCAKEIRRQFGVRRTVEATRRHGSRIGCSWLRYELCPECGKPMTSMPDHLRMCRDCNAKRLRDAAKLRAERAVVETARDGSGEQFAGYKREYDMYRKRLCDIRKRARQEQVC